MLLLAVAATLLSRAALPAYFNLTDRSGAGQTQQALAPIVVVAVIRSDELVREPVPKQDAPSYPMQLRRLTLQIENVLKGDVPESVAEAYYFTFAGGFDGPRPLGMWPLGGRRIFSLLRDNGLLRTSCDGWDGCSIGVYSGAHLDYRSDSRRDVEYAMDDILLTRGTGPVQEGHFAAAIERGGRAPMAYQIAKLRALALTETGPVKVAACQVLGYNASESTSLPGAVAPSEEILRTMIQARRAMSDANCRCKNDSGRSLSCWWPAGVNPR